VIDRQLDGISRRQTRGDDQRAAIDDIDQKVAQHLEIVLAVERDTGVGTDPARLPPARKIRREDFVIVGQKVGGQAPFM
jgi:hypothetical protein